MKITFGDTYACYEHDDEDYYSLAKKERENNYKYRNNPDRKPQGHYTGRCGACGSQDLWDDVTAYGCNACGQTYFTG